jgi:hypothetical protein
MLAILYDVANAFIIYQELHDNKNQCIGNINIDRKYNHLHNADIVTYFQS